MSGVWVNDGGRWAWVNDDGSAKWSNCDGDAAARARLDEQIRAATTDLAAELRALRAENERLKDALERVRAIANARGFGWADYVDAALVAAGSPLSPPSPEFIARWAAATTEETT